MVFSSLPAYLDPANWQQQPNPHHHNIYNSQQLHHLPPPPPPPLLPSGSGGSAPGGAGSIRPGSMADRARMANIPMPEQALKCPRCDSTNTKFCYFNNYSLTQPRHFCKTCRRYWTCGGALRSVPVGGGCRRNKRNSNKGGGSSRSKSPASCSSDRPAGSASSSGHQGFPSNSSAGTSDMIAAGLNSQMGQMGQIPPLRFVNPFTDPHNFNENYGGGGVGELGFQIGGGIPNPSQQWRFQNQTPSFPFLSGGLDASNGLFESNGLNGVEFLGYSHMRPRLLSNGGSSSVGVSSSQMAPVKTEDPHNQSHQLNLSRQLSGIQEGNDNQYWINGNGNGNGALTTAWTDLSGCSSTSTGTINHPL